MNISNIHRGLGAAMAFWGLASADAAAATYAKLSDHRVVLRSEGGKAVFEGAGFDRPSGSPALPKYTLRFLLPTGTDEKTVSVKIENIKTEIVTGTYDVAPVPPLIGNGGPTWPSGSIIRDGKDLVVYGKNAFYPASHLGKTRTSKLGTFQVVEVELNEYLYNPVTRQLRHVVDGDLVVNSSAVTASEVGTGTRSAYEIRTEKSLKDLVANHGTAVQIYPKTVASMSPNAAGPSTYLIVTTDAILNSTYNLNLFADAKVASGFNVEAVTPTKHVKRVGSLWSCVDTRNCLGGWGGGTGDVAAERIRTWLKSKYIARNIEYALLIGNPDPATGDVPMKMMWPRNNQKGTLEERQNPTDYYYAELTGNWDLDGDGYYGEEDNDAGPGGMDNLSEIVVGRIPHYGVTSYLNKILAKTIRYQQEEDKSWRSKMLISLRMMSAPGSEHYVGENLKRTLLAPRGWGAYRIYDSLYGTDPEANPTNEENVLKAWKNNAFGMHVWVTHGAKDYAVDIFSSQSASELDDAHPSITFQGSCNTAYPEYSRNLAYSILKNGGIATVGATRVTWYWSGQTSFHGDDGSYANVARKFAGYLIEDTMPVGKAWARVRATTDGWWMNMQGFNLYGDPSIVLGDAPALLPVAPRISSAVPGNQNVTVKWDSVARATGYLVTATTSTNSTTMGPIAGASYQMTGLVNGKTYGFTVKAMNVHGKSMASDTVKVVVGVIAPPPVPSGFVAVAGDRRASLAWKASSGATKYVVERATSSTSFAPMIETRSLSFVDSSLANGSRYLYRIRAVNAGGSSAPTAQIAVTPGLAEPCSPATSVTNNTGNFNTTGKACYKTTQNISGWGCSSFDGRTVKVNGVRVSCGGALPAKTNGAYYFDVSAGTYSWASIYWW
ncbi:MAG TPA: C25 family cysteine peptidase [Fibrobacteria bacterium]|nr:C25 family cysteine peptidase [Fibrobacteria bacterium]